MPCVTRSWAVSQRAIALVCHKRWKSNHSVAVTGAKNPCDVRWDWFGFSWSFAWQWLQDPLCPPFWGGHKLPAGRAMSCTCWVSPRWLMAPQTLVLFANFISHWDYLMIVPISEVFFTSCSPITLLSFSAPNDRAVREWLMSRGWAERCNLGGSCPICGEFSAAKSPAGIIDLALPIDQTPALTAELLEPLSREKAVAFFLWGPCPVSSDGWETATWRLHPRRTWVISSWKLLKQGLASKVRQLKSYCLPGFSI